MTELINNSGFWFGIALINTFFLFRTFIYNIVLKKKLEGAAVVLVAKNKEIMEIESLLGDKITSLMDQLEELRNS
jgi:hypothetical protein